MWRILLQVKLNTIFSFRRCWKVPLNVPVKQAKSDPPSSGQNRCEISFVTPKMYRQNARSRSRPRPHYGKIPIFVQKIKFSIIPFLAGKFKFNIAVDFIKIEFLDKKLRFCISVATSDGVAFSYERHLPLSRFVSMGARIPQQFFVMGWIIVVFVVVLV